MEDPLAVVNTLHQVLANAGLHADLGLPQIAVVGSQSVGKTSVLQSLVGRDFLPRGTGIVTRRPLVLQLRSTAEAPKGDGVAEWAEFAHKLGKEMTSFDEVRKEIELETERLCGDRSGVSDEPILLRIFSPSVMDLTLVDLPGLTKVPTGDQPSDISERIHDLVLRYINPKSCLILAVSAANTDLATSDSLALARKVDPLGERTLGVLTKLDLADESGSALEALSGKVYPLRLGYVGVVCRNEQASKKGVTFEESIKAEEDFLRQKRSLVAVADHCGIPHLARRLHELLLRHVREALPDLRGRVQRVADETRLELETFGDVSLEQRMGQGAFLLHLISGYVRNFAEALEGRLAYSLQEQPPDKLVGGARVHYIFHRVFAQAVLDFDAFSGLTDLEIRVAMRNAAGPKPQLFVPEVAFETLVKRQISKLEDPSLQCVHLVHEELKHLTLQSEVPEMQRFPALRDKVLEVAQSVIKRCLQPTIQIVQNLIRIELAHINVDHPDFIGGLKAMTTVQDSVTTNSGAQGSAPAMASLQQFLSDDGDSREPWWQADAQGLAENQGTSSEDASHLVRPSASANTPGQRRNRWGELQRSLGSEEPLRLPSVPLVVAPSSEPSEKERMDTELLKSLVSSYFAIVKKKVVDAVPKTIMHFMVNAVNNTLLHECIAELYRSDLYTTLLSEAEDVRQRCAELNKKLSELRNILDVLAQVRDSSF